MSDINIITLDNLNQTGVTLEQLIEENLDEEIRYFRGMKRNSEINFELKSISGELNPKLFPNSSDGNRRINLNFPPSAVSLKLARNEKEYDSSYISTYIEAVDIFDENTGESIVLVSADDIRIFFFELVNYYVKVDRALFEGPNRLRYFAYTQRVSSSDQSTLERHFASRVNTLRSEFRENFFFKFNLSIRSSPTSEYEKISKFELADYFTNPDLINTLNFSNIRIIYFASVAYKKTFGIANDEYLNQYGKLQTYTNCIETLGDMGFDIIDHKIIHSLTNDQMTSYVENMNAQDPSKLYDLLITARDNLIYAITAPPYIEYDKWMLEDHLKSKVNYAEVSSSLTLCSTKKLGLSTDANIVNIFRQEVRTNSYTKISNLGIFANNVSTPDANEIRAEISSSSIPTIHFSDVQTVGMGQPGQISSNQDNMQIQNSPSQNNIPQNYSTQTIPQNYQQNSPPQNNMLHNYQQNYPPQNNIPQSIPQSTQNYPPQNNIPQSIPQSTQNYPSQNSIPQSTQNYPPQNNIPQSIPQSTQNTTPFLPQNNIPQSTQNYPPQNTTPYSHPPHILFQTSMTSDEVPSQPQEVPSNISEVIDTLNSHQYN